MGKRKVVSITPSYRITHSSESTHSAPISISDTALTFAISLFFQPLPQWMLKWGHAYHWRYFFKRLNHMWAYFFFECCSNKCGTSSQLNVRVKGRNVSASGPFVCTQCGRSLSCKKNLVRYVLEAISCSLSKINNAGWFESLLILQNFSKFLQEFNFDQYGG